MSLSEKYVGSLDHDRLFQERDLKQAIKELKERLCPELKMEEIDYESGWDRIPQTEIWRVIDEIFGEGLV